MNFIIKLQGYKTYIVSGVSEFYAVLSLIQGHHYTQVIPYIFAGAFGSTLRAALKKLEKKLPVADQSIVNDLIKG
jgi:hypothetical protein